MKEEIKNLWVDALRSGKYKQGEHRLRNKFDEFCCLGVLCDISKQGEWNLGFDGYFYESNGCKSFYSLIIKEWAGMHSSIGSYCFLNPALSDLNDDGKTFEEIANIIEENWEEL